MINSYCPTAPPPNKNLATTLQFVVPQFALLLSFFLISLLFLYLFTGQNLVCVVTGAASGLGRATAEMLLSNGARTILADLPPTPPRSAAEVVSQITACSPASADNCQFLATDVS